MASDADRRPPFDPARLTADLPGWLRVEVVEETGSTNADVSARARAGEREGLVLVAEQQTSGRGRLARTWESPARAGLTFSVLLRPGPDVPADRWGWLPLLAGLSVCEGLDTVGAPNCRVKWPNDVLYDGKKLAGVLSERVDGADTAEGPAAVLGIGLNVTTTAQELPIAEATSLRLAGSPALEREVVLGEVLRRLAERYSAWRAAADDTALAGAYQARCSTIGAELEVHLPDGGRFGGVGRRVAEDGALVVDRPEGETVVRAGDVVHTSVVRGPVRDMIHRCLPR